MITKINDIYEKVAKKHNLDPQIVKSVGDCVFSHLKERMMSWEESSLNVSHLGFFVLKSKKIERQLKNWLLWRKYKVGQDPTFINKPIPSHIQKKLKIYFLKILPYKKAKKEHSKKQIEFCKQLYESYEKNNNKAT